MSKKRKETGRKMGIVQTLLVACIGAAIGGGGKMAAGMHEDSLRTFLDRSEGWFMDHSSWLLLLSSAAICILCTVFVLRMRKACSRCEEEDEVEAERIEKMQQRYQSFMGLFIAVEAILSGVVIASLGGSQGDSFTLAAIGTFFLSAVWILISWDRLVKYEKQMNPEKKGNIFSWNFNKEWLQSCDEREKLKLFRAAYYTHLSMQILYLVIFCVLILLSGIVKVGVLPFVILGAVWMFQLLSYQYQYEHKNE